MEALDRRQRLVIVEPDTLGLGRDEARCDCIHSNPVAAGAGGERAHHRRHTALGGRVRVEAGAADQCVDRARDDNRPRALGDHLPSDMLHDPERPREVDVDHAIPDLVVELGQPPIARVDEVDVGGAVVEGVDAAEASDGLGDEALDQLGRCDVDVHRNGGPAVLGDRRGDGLCALERHVRDDDRRALGRHRRCAGASHSGTASDDERHLVLQPATRHRSSFASW